MLLTDIVQPTDTQLAEKKKTELNTLAFQLGRNNTYLIEVYCDGKTEFYQVPGSSSLYKLKIASGVKSDAACQYLKDEGHSTQVKLTLLKTIGNSTVMDYFTLGKPGRLIIETPNAPIVRMPFDQVAPIHTFNRSSEDPEHLKNKVQS